MHNRILINLVLFIIVVITGIFLYLTTPEKDSSPLERLTDIDTATIKEIKIIRRELDDLIFKNSPNGWYMETPYYYLANPQRIQTLLNLLQSISIAQLDANPDELHRFLLDDPRASVRFNEVQIDFGDSSPLGNQRYVKLSEQIHLINEGLFQQLLTPATFFLSPELIPGNKKINSIMFSDHTMQLQDGSWQVIPETTISIDKLNDLVNTWENVQALTINKLSDQNTGEKIIIGIDPDKVIEFVIVRDPPDLILGRTDLGLQFHLNEFDTERMFLDLIRQSENNDSHTDND